MTIAIPTKWTSAQTHLQIPSLILMAQRLPLMARTPTAPIILQTLPHLRRGMHRCKQGTPSGHKLGFTKMACCRHPEQCRQYLNDGALIWCDERRCGRDDFTIHDATQSRAEMQTCVGRCGFHTKLGGKATCVVDVLRNQKWWAITEGVQKENI